MLPFKKRLHVAAICGFALPLISPMVFASGTAGNNGRSLVFDPAKFTVKSATLNGRTFSYRAYEGIVYVKFPVDSRYQSMNIYVPAEYYEGRSIGPYNADTAPIFLPNSIGGYMPGPAGSPGPGFDGPVNAALVALSKGYVVAAPGARGRTNTDTSGNYTGKAPAAIVDLKAAVRYLRANDQRMPGTAEKIISNGTSAGGALSALLGATGDNQDYAPYLKALGAADARDDIFAVSAYCPITNLDNADMAYEWLFSGINEYMGGRMPPPPGHGPADAMGPGSAPPPHPQSPMPKQTMSAEQVRNSQLLKAQFPAYLNSLGLKSPEGKLLTLDANGEGPFKDYVKSLVITSAQNALESGKDLTSLTWIKIQSGTVIDIDFAAFAHFAGRMKATSAFDGLDLGTGENSLFGTRTINAQHFTQFGLAHSTAKGSPASAGIVKLMNPMNYIGAQGTTTAQYWRIRHGAVDRDTSLAVPTILATRLENSGAKVDFASPWGRGHSGDYDLDELFSWVEQVCR